MIRNVASGIDGDIPAARSHERRRSKFTLVVIEVIAGLFEYKLAGKGTARAVLRLSNTEIKDIRGTAEINSDLTAARISIRE